MKKDLFLEKLAVLESISGNHELFSAVKQLYSACFESSKYGNVTPYTNALLEKLEEGLLSYEDVCKECLTEMSEDDVEDMYTRYLDLPELEYSSEPRQYTNELLKLLDEGALSYETVCKECIAEMSEDAVEEMCRTCEYVTDEEMDDDSEEEESDEDEKLDELIDEMESIDDISELNDIVSYDRISDFSTEAISKIIRLYITLCKKNGIHAEFIDSNNTLDEDTFITNITLKMNDALSATFSVNIPFERVYRNMNFSVKKDIFSDDRCTVNNVSFDIDDAEYDFSSDTELLKCMLDDAGDDFTVNEDINDSVNDMINYHLR